METKNKVVLSVLALAGAFCLGYYCTPEKVKTQIVEKESTKVDQKVDNKKHVKVIVVDHTLPNGDHTTTTTTEEQNDTQTETKLKDATTAKESQTPVSGSKIHVQLIGGTEFQPNPLHPIFYGAHVSKDFVGPISLGVMALTNGNVGVSIGISF